MLTYHPTTEAEKEAICAWQYPGEYAMYNNPPCIQICWTSQTIC